MGYRVSSPGGDMMPEKLFLYLAGFIQGVIMGAAILGALVQ